MENVYRGQIAFLNGVAESRALRAGVSRAIHRWLADQDLIVANIELNYRILFERTGPGHLIDCEVEIHDGHSCVWTSSGFGASADQALNHCLYAPHIALRKILLDAGAITA